MSIFKPHSIVLADYRDFVRSFFTVADERGGHLFRGVAASLIVIPEDLPKMYE